MHTAPAGDRALLIDLGEVDARTLHAYAVAARALDGVIAAIPGQRSLYVVFDREPAGDLELHASDVSLTPATHTIEVNFDGEDLDEFLAHARVTREELTRRIPRLTARYIGFRAGFAYLEGWPREWAMPRRPTSRPVKRGSFALADNITGFYPTDSPGGWNILGHTDVPLVNRIAPGDEIVIVPVSREMSPPPVVDPPPPFVADFSGPLAQVVTRADWSRIPVSGPFDPELAAFANRLAGNPDDAPLIECAMVAPRVRGSYVAAWVGAECDWPNATPFTIEGESSGGRIRNGLRGWLSVAAGASPAVRRASAAAPEASSERRARARASTLNRHVIRVVPGPHETPLRTIACEVTPQLNRVGIRLKPLDPINIAAPADLPSCGMQFGTIQLHPDGSLVAMGPDHPVTGGYLQPMTVRWDERWKLAQLMPSERVVFTTE
jgi:allophanate hydrolase subunit 1/allophanate hydrolase subunit 2